MPPGVVGQIHIAGSKEAPGDRNRPNPTAERFVEIGLDDGPVRLLHRTGGFGRRRADGTVERLGESGPRASPRTNRGAANEAAPPVTATERCIAAIWQDLLGIPRVDVHDNFYDLGGHSLLSLQAIARIERATGVQLHPQEVALQSLGQLAAHCDRITGGLALQLVGETDADARDQAFAREADRGQTASPASATAPIVAGDDSRQPFFFGPDGELFGCLQVPQSGARNTGVVVCPPFGQEHIQAHRSLVQLAGRLARAGLPVLRFDHFGCGDSAGACDEGSIERWTEDVGIALDEMRERCGVATISLIGLRLGGALAATAAATRGDVRSLVLWDPVVRGTDYLRELREMQRRMLAFAYVAPSHATSIEEVLGFPLHDRLKRDLAGIDLHALADCPAEHVLLLDSGAQERLTELAARLEQLPLRLDHRHVQDLQVWLEEPSPGLVPNRALEAIVAWLVERQP